MLYLYINEFEGVEDVVIDLGEGEDGNDSSEDEQEDGEETNKLDPIQEVRP